MRILFYCSALSFSLAMGSCSTTTFDRTSCQTNDECSVFGAASVCGADGFCTSEGNVTPGFEPRIGFVFSSVTSDRGWSATHFAAAQEVADTFDAPLTFREDIRNAGVAEAIDQLITEDDANIIFTVSSGYIGDTVMASIAHPDRYFVSCCGRAMNDNLTSYFGRMYQPIYVLGYVAAKMSCTKRLGIVAAFPFPQFVRHINAFTLGAQLAASEDGFDVEVDVRFIDAFFNIDNERDAAESLMDDGADVIFAQSNSSQPVEARPGATIACDDGTGMADRPVYRIGYHSPVACEFNPTQCISAAHWNWSSLYRDKIQSIIDGTFDPSDVDWSSMTNSADSVVNYAQLANFVPGDLAARAGQLKAEAIANPQLPFVGPLSDNMGTQQIAAGQTLTDIELDEMCYFVDGVIEGTGDETVPRTVPPRCSE